MLEAAKVSSSDGEQAKRGDEQHIYTQRRRKPAGEMTLKP
jgi:hypothetical protein